MKEFHDDQNLNSIYVSKGYTFKFYYNVAASAFFINFSNRAGISEFFTIYVQNEIEIDHEVSGEKNILRAQAYICNAIKDVDEVSKLQWIRVETFIQAMRGDLWPTTGRI